MTAIEGIDVENVSAWFDANIPGARGPYQFELIAGGRSNLTFKVTGADGTQFVLRRPPTSHVLPSAHDMGREHRIISALGPTAVPVAPALGFCAAETVNGRPFYVMGFVDGYILRDAATVTAAFDEAQRAVIAHDLIDVLVALHAVDI
ncbi:MAG TPA: phosphotransferase family protein, partial [Acidimicrobiales bacterium]|nr:phosphotransferase family protein [Acidimicrobiales bacterium]